MTDSNRADVVVLMPTLHEDRTDPTRLSLDERWADTAAIAEHDRSAHVAGFATHLDDLLAQPLEVRRLRFAD